MTTPTSSGIPERARWAHALPVALLGITGSLACASTPAPAPGPPVDAEEVSLLTEERTRLDEPTLVVFGWTATEQGARFEGTGVARMEPPYKARLDLFLENGELAAQAALVGDVLTIPEGVPDGMIPPAPLLWATLGVFRPGLSSYPLGGTSEVGGAVTLRHALSGGVEVRFRLAEGRIAGAELARGGRVEERVELEWRDDDGLPQVARYRNLPAFRELTVSVESVEHVETFSPDIWTLGR